MKLEVVTVLKENKHLAELISKIKEENDEIAKKLRHYSGNKVLFGTFFHRVYCWTVSLVFTSIFVGVQHRCSPV